MFKRMILAGNFGGFAYGLFPCLQMCTFELGCFSLYSRDLSAALEMCAHVLSGGGNELGKRSPSAKSCSCLQIRRAVLHFADCPTLSGSAGGESQMPHKSRPINCAQKSPNRWNPGWESMDVYRMTTHVLQASYHT